MSLKEESETQHYKGNPAPFRLYPIYKFGIVGIFARERSLSKILGKFLQKC
jgi:hypothetical protein